MIKLRVINLFSLILGLWGCGVNPANETRLDSLLNSGINRASSTPTPNPGSTSTSTPVPTPTPTPSLTLLTDGTHGRAYYYNTCLSASGITPTAPAPFTGGTSEIEFSLSEYSAPSIHECHPVSNNTQLIEIAWNVTSSIAAKYSTMTINWQGTAGQYLGTCSGSAPTSLFTPRAIQIFDGTQWNDLTTGVPDISASTVNQTFNFPVNYVFSNQIWIRVSAQANTAECATIQTTFSSLTLNP